MACALLVFTISVLGAGLASAQGYPTKPIRIVVPFAPGGGTDLLARLYAQRLLEWHGQAATVDNRPGAGGNIGAEIVAKSPPDGYTILFSTASLAVNVTLYPKLAYNLQRDFIPITQMAASPIVLVAHPSVPASSVKDLVQLSKKRKGGVNFGSNGNGTTSHLSGLLMNQMAGLEITHVPFKGAGAAINAMLTGETDISFLATFSAVTHVKAKRMKALGVSTKKRSPALPDVPTLDSMYPGFETDNWFALFVPAGTPQPVVQLLYDAVVKGIQHPSIKNFIEREGGYAIGNSQEEFKAVLAREIEKYGKLVKSSGARPDQ